MWDTRLQFVVVGDCVHWPPGKKKMKEGLKLSGRTRHVFVLWGSLEAPNEKYAEEEE